MAVLTLAYRRVGARSRANGGHRKHPSRASALLPAGLLFWSVSVATAYAGTLSQRIDGHLAEPRFASASWGVSVVSLEDGRTVYAHDAGRLLLPASTAKLYTAAFALDRLGADYRTYTDVLMAGELRKGRLHGDLVLRGGGDPTLAGNAWADLLAATVRERGIRRIDGAVVGDDTVFAGSPIGNGWEAADLQTYYGAQAGGLDIDENTMTATLSASGIVVQPKDAAVAVALDPEKRFGIYRAPGTATVHVLGAEGASVPTRTSRLSIPDPALTAARRLQAALERQDIRVDGEARSALWPVPAPGGDSVASWPSPPLATILRDGLKRSQNLYLQSVFLLTGRATGDQGASGPDADGGSAEARAADALAAWLAARGIGPASTTMVEGTGMSRHDLTTAASLTHLLATMDASPIAALWRGLLPVAGVDGTLANRMRDTAAQGNVVAKTGSMSYVNSLAGYVTTKSGQRLAFAIVLNNYRAPSRSAEPVKPVSAEVDAIAVMLAEATERL